MDGAIQQGGSLMNNTTSATLETGIFLETPVASFTPATIIDSLVGAVRTNLRAFSAVVNASETMCSMIAEDHSALVSHLDQNGVAYQEQTFVIVPVSDTQGAALAVMQQITDANIDVHSCFSTIFNGSFALVLSTADNKAALRLLK
jgi:hypothetical protein